MQCSSSCTAQLVRLMCDLGSTPHEATVHAKGYTCKRCYKALERCTALKEQLDKIESDLKSNLCTSLSNLDNSRVVSSEMPGSSAAAPCRSSSLGRKRQGAGERRFEGFVPVIEDWHTKMCAMKVSCYNCMPVQLSWTAP